MDTMKRIALFMIICLSACSPLAASITETPESVSLPSITPTKTRTVTPMASPTPSPTPAPETFQTISPSPTRAPTATIPWPDYPPLKTGGPYIAWSDPFLGELIMNADGSGLGRVDLPSQEIDLSRNSSNGGKATILGEIRNVSPDGKWALLYQGGPFESSEEMDLTMSLVHLPDGEILGESTIMPSKAWVTRYNSYECGMSYFYSHFRLAAWSPDGTYLAFAAYADSGTTDLFAMDLRDRSVRRLTNDPAEIDAIVWSPDGATLYYTNGNGFDPQWADFISYSLNAIRPWNSTNTGIQTVTLRKEKLRLEGFDGDTGILYSVRRDLGCLAGGMPTSQEIRYFHLDTGDDIVLQTGDIYQRTLLIDSVNRVLFSTRYDPEAETFSKQKTEIVSFEGRALVQLEGTYLFCDQPVFLGGPRLAYLCANWADQMTITGVTFGGEIDPLQGRGTLALSPDRKSYLVYEDRVIASLYSLDGTLLDAWDVNESFQFLWSPDGSGFYATPNGRDLVHYSTTDRQESMMYACGVEKRCVISRLLWIP
jgi:hypothetical protein